MSRSLGLRALFFVVFGCGGLLAFGQTSSQAFGLSANNATGTGLTYRAWFDDLGFQVATLPVVTADTVALPVGAEVLWSLERSSWTQAYLFAGAVGDPATSGRLALAGGFGYSLWFFGHLGVDFQLGYGLNLAGGLQSLMAVGTSLFYRVPL